MGCDRNAMGTVFSSSCARCVHAGHSYECVDCRGRGQVAHRRCPSALADTEAFLVVRVYAERERGFLPFNCGWAEMPARLTYLVDLVASERSKIMAAKPGEGGG